MQKQIDFTAMSLASAFRIVKFDKSLKIILNLSRANKILIIRLSSLGDILLSTPLIRAIKNKYPGIKIDFLLRQEYSDLIKLNPHIRNILYYNDSPALKEEIKKNNYDLIIDLQNNFRSAALRKGSQAAAVKFNKRSINKFLLVNLKINRLKNAPPIPVRYAETIDEINLDDKGLDLFTDRKASIILSDESKFIGFAPGARHFTKRWPEDYFIKLGEILSDNGYKIILFGGKEDVERCSNIAAHLAGSINLCKGDDILQITADMKLCSAVICNDSGMMHTACAAGVRVLSIFGSSVTEFGFTPYSRQSLVLENKLLSCRPCSHIGKSRCPQGHFKCMLEITPDEAYKNLMDLLS